MVLRRPDPLQPHPVPREILGAHLPLPTVRAEGPDPQVSLVPQHRQPQPDGRRLLRHSAAVPPRPVQLGLLRRGPREMRRQAGAVHLNGRAEHSDGPRNHERPRQGFLGAEDRKEEEGRAGWCFPTRRTVSFFFFSQSFLVEGGRV